MAKEEISYWNGNGTYQDVHKVLWSKYVPDSGESLHRFGEVTRCLGRLWHEYCNNGNGNARENYHEVSRMFQGMLDTIRQTIFGVDDEIEEVENLILGSRNHTFSQKELDVYNRLTNKCYEFIIEAMNINLGEYRLLAIEADIKDNQKTVNFYKAEIEHKTMVLKTLTSKDSEEIAKLHNAIEHNMGTVSTYEGKVAELREKWIAEKMQQNLVK
jgi:hypothetical protein